MTVNKDRVELWAQALESDGYKQCRGNLRLQQNYPMHCAEGVAMAVAEMHGVQINRDEWDETCMPPQVSRWYGLPAVAFVDHGDMGRMTVIAANDMAHLSFWEIAQLLRAKYVKGEEQ